jgi:hypothetical protein
MSIVADISFSLEIIYHHSIQFVFYNVLLFYSLTKVGFHCIYAIYDIVLLLSHFILIYNMHQLYQINLLLVISRCITTTWLGYRELGLELVSLGDNHSRRPKKPPMVEENKYDGLGHPFKNFLEEALA